MPRNWWFDNQGVNNLKGVENDPTNRIILPDDSIINFLLRSPQARRDFQALVPTMLPDEQERLNGIVARYPRVLFDDPMPDPQVVDDRFMASQNKPGFFDPNRRKR